MRSQPLDMLRGVAILLVLGHHALAGPAADAIPLAALGQAWQRGGWMGVDLFFVLSGFLVSGLLFKEYMIHGDVRLGRFLARRGFKIYPAFYAFLIILLLFGISRGPIEDWSPILCETFFVQNYGPNIAGHTWSLAVEEHFYLLLCLYFAWRLYRPRPRPFRALPLLVLLLAVACLGMRIAMTRVPFAQKTHIHATHLRLDALAFGVLISYCYHFYPEFLAGLVHRRRLLFLTMGLCLVAPCFVLDLNESTYVHTLGLTLDYVGWGCVLLATVYWRPNLSHWMQPARALFAVIGFYSYSIYIWHQSTQNGLVAVFRAAKLIAPIPYPVVLAIYVLAAVLVGTLMAKLIETPFLRLRDRWLPSRGKALVSPNGSPAT